MEKITCTIDGTEYELVDAKGFCDGCAAWNTTNLDARELCAKLPECEGGVWVETGKGE